MSPDERIARIGSTPLDHRFEDELRAVTAGDSRLETCIQCGTCGGSCPSAADMDHTPRMLFALVRAGMRDEALRSNTPWMCVSCYFCVVRCPQGIHIPDVMYTLKAIAGGEGARSRSTAPDFSRMFVANIQRYGRSLEIGLAAAPLPAPLPARLPRMAPDGRRDGARAGRMGLRAGPHQGA